MKDNVPTKANPLVCNFQTILILLYGPFNPAFVTGFHAGFRTVTDSMYVLYV
jgi:hypothetical protein